MPDFIDRAKLEALAEERYPLRLPYNRKFEKDAQDRVTFMAGVDATLALLDAETTEEWGVRHISVDGWPREVGHTGEEAAERDLETCGWNCHLVSRRVLYGPWLPSEGGEKP